MSTVVNFLEALIISWVIVCAVYEIAVLAMRSSSWTLRFAFWAILYATFRATPLIVSSISWMTRSLALFGQGANNIQSSRAGSTAAVSHTAEPKGMPSPRLWPSFSDVAISVREAREDLFAYERRALTARSEIRATVTRTLETIAQTQTLMAQVDAVSRGLARS